MRKIFIAGIIGAALLMSYALQSQTWKETATAARQMMQERKYEDALRFAQASLQKAESQYGKKSEFYAQSLSFIGEIYYGMGNYDEATENFRLEIDILKKIADDQHPLYAKALNNLSTTYQRMGKPKLAESLLLETINIKKKSVGENDTSYAVSLQNLAVLYQDIGKYTEAEKLFFQAADIRKEKQGADNISYAQTIYSLGVLYNALGNTKESINNLSKALDIFVKKLGDNHPLTASARYQLAMTYMSEGKANLAEPLLSKAQEFRKMSMGEKNPDYVNTLYNLAMVKWQENKLEEAEATLLEAKGIIEKNFGNGFPKYSSCLNSLGVISWKEGKMDEAYNYLSQSVNIREKTLGLNHPDLAGTYHMFAGVLKESGRYKEAESYYKKAMTLYLQQIKNYFPFLSETEKARFYDNLKEKFDLFNCYVISRYDENPSLLEDMYNYHIATKAILLNNSIKVRKRIQESGDAALISKFEKWQSLKEDLSGYYQLSNQELAAKKIDLESLENTANAMEKELSSASALFGKQFEKKKITWQDIQKNLKKDEAAIEIIRIRWFQNKWTDTVHYIALIVTSETKGHPDAVFLRHGRDLEKFYIVNYVRSIQSQIPDKDSYDAFWADIDEKIAGKKTIYLSVDGIYNKINVNTLLKPDGKYVIDYQNIMLVSNTKEIADKAGGTQSGDKDNACLIGNPDFKASSSGQNTLSMIENNLSLEGNSDVESMGNIPQLPGSKIELEQVNNMLKSKSWKTVIYEDAQANESNFKTIRNTSLLHIATHGYFLPDLGLVKQDKAFGVDFVKATENPLLRSGIFLAGAANTLAQIKTTGKNRSDGIISAYEIMNLNFDNIGLVVLSSCETGLGEIKNGEGVYGLQRAFLVAGTKSLIMSLWKINDETTRELMEAFYKNWLSGKKISESLHLAQLQIREKYPQPYFWGAFVLNGIVE